MNKPVPWNIRGVGFDAREAARIAAKRAGVPLGEWLNDIIATRAAELGVTTEDIAADDRLEAIAARLSTGETHRGLGFGESPAPLPERGGIDAATVAATWRDRQRPSLLPPRSVATDERAATAGAGRRLPAVAARPPAPAGSVVTARLGTADTLELDRAPAETAGGASRLGRSDPPPAGRSNGGSDTQPPVAGDLDQRLNAILSKLNRSFEEAERFGESAAAQLGKASPAAAEPAHAPAEPTPVAAPPRRLPLDEAAPPSGRDGFADLQAAYKDLAGRLDAQAAVTERAARQDVNLERQFASLAKRVEALQTPPASARADAEMGRLQRDVADLSDRLTELAPDKALASLEAAVKELGARIDLSRLDGVKSSVLAPVERLSRDMREAIRAADPSRLVEALHRDMRILAGKVEAMPRGSDGDALAAMRRDLGELRTSFDAACKGLALTDQLHGEIVDLGRRVDALAERTTPAMSRGLDKAIGDIRDLLQHVGPNGLLGSIDRRVTTLTHRVDALAEGQLSESIIENLTREIERAHDTLATRLAQQPEPARLTRIEERIGGLSAKIDAVGRGNDDLAALYGLVGELTARIEDARRPNADSQAMLALQNQVGHLVDRFDRSEAGTTSLGSLERLIGDLFLQVEQTRDVALDAAENAARTAAQDTLRAALDNPALNGGELTVQTGLDVDRVSQELAELRRLQEVSERRVNTTLTALNATLERLVDRMLAEQTGGAPSPSTESPPAAAAAEARRARRRRVVDDLGRTTAEGGAASVPFDPEHFLLEPGSLMDSVAMPALPIEPESPAAAAPRLDVGPRDPAKANDVGPLIAAARRAAQMAQASAIEAAATAGDAPDATGGTNQLGRLRSFFSRRRRPLLLSLAGLVLLLGTVEAVRLSTQDTGEADTAGGKTAPAALPAPAAAAPAAGPAVETPAPAAETPPGPSKPASGDTSLLTPPATGETAGRGFTSDADAGKPMAAPLPSVAAADTLAVAPQPSAGIAPGLRDLAAGGNRAAQFEVGSRMADGRGVARDPKQAADWFDKAAQAGLAPAQYRLGSVYEKGVGRAADPGLAVAWYEKAANGGNIRAMHNLAVMLAAGAGAKPDYGRAATWFTKAANYGVRDSQFNLAVLFARGLGVPQNLGQSYTWFALAADQGDPDAAKKRDAIGAKLDAGTLADAKAAVDAFKAQTPDPAANTVAPPPGGWDAAAPAKTAGRKTEARVSSM